MNEEHISADALYSMCDGLIDSDNPEEFSRGLSLLRRAAYHPSPIKDAQFELAYLMELGRVSPDSDDERFQLYEAAAIAGDPEAMLACAHYLENGIGAECNVKAAIDLYLKAAEVGYEEGYLLAGLLADDERDLKKAAQAGFVAAMLELAPKYLAEMHQSYPSYRFDTGLEAFQAGIYYYEMASAKGNLEATLALADIYERGWETCWPHRFPDGWSELCSEIDRLESALACYDHAKKLGCEWAEREIARINNLLDSCVEADDNE